MTQNRTQTTLFLVSIGPGKLDQMTQAAHSVLQQVDVVIGYKVYTEMIRPILAPHQQLIESPIGQEIERATQAVTLAAGGQSVAMISSGDIGIYAMAGPIFDVLRQRQWQGEDPVVEIYPGISAVQAASARLGAPLSHDFCTISLSDLLTPWDVIQKRVEAAAWGDFVIAFYNPRSRKRDWQLQWAKEMLLKHRSGETPVATVRNVTRPDEEIHVTTLDQFDPQQVDMFTMVLVGNSQSYPIAGGIATPRGYV